MIADQMQAAGEPRTRAAAPGAGSLPHRPNLARALLPLVLGGTIALLPSPEGLEPTAWLYFAVFVTVIAGVVTEPLAPAALGLAGVTVAAAFGLVRDSPSQSAQWALSGFGNPAVWLIFAAYMLTLGYAATGLGRRIALQLVRAMGHRTLGLGYAVTLADLTLAPFTASATARSGGTIYPVIRHIPELYQSHPDDRSSRRIGGYLLYTAMAASFITSSMFITALAPNALAISIIEQVTGVRIAWMDWFIGFAPVGITLLAIVPALLYRIYPPQIRRSPEARIWAGDELRLLGPMKRSELTLLLLVVLALALWIGAADAIDPALAAIVVVVLMVGCRVVSWEDVIGNAPAWNVLIWFGTLVTLAGGLGETGFMEWLAGTLAPAFTGLGYYTSIIAVVGAFFFLHYFFASITAHTATLLPVFLAIAVTLPGPSPVMWALLLGYSLGLMSVLTSYAAGQNVIYYSSGYIARRDFWLLGFVMGLLFLATYILIGIPWLQFLGV